MGAVVLFAALSLALSVLSSPFAPLLAQMPSTVLPSAALAPVAAPSLIESELALLPDAPLPAVTAVAIAPAIAAVPPFLNSPAPEPLTPAQKALLAFDNFKDPANLTSIAYSAAFTIATDSHTAYGPGWKGFGENTGYRLVRDATAEFVGTFLIPSIVHQDPRYHRMPEATIPRRILHAVSHTVIAQSDNGKPMPNVGTLLGTPIRAEIANLYVPGVGCNGPDTAERILNSYATHPIDDVVTEFLPDLARHVHIRVLFAQRLFNEMSGTR